MKLAVTNVWCEFKLSELLPSPDSTQPWRLPTSELMRMRQRYRRKCTMDASSASSPSSTPLLTDTSEFIQPLSIILIISSLIGSNLCEIFRTYFLMHLMGLKEEADDRLPDCNGTSVSGYTWTPPGVRQVTDTCWNSLEIMSFTRYVSPFVGFFVCYTLKPVWVRIDYNHSFNSEPLNLLSVM